MSKSPLYRSSSSGLVAEVASTDVVGPIADPVISTDAATKNYVDTHTGAPAGTSVTTASQSYTANQRVTFDLTMAKTFASWKSTEATAKKFRLQLYSTSAARTADATRPFTIPLPLGTQHQCIVDMYIDQVNDTTPFILSPAIIGSNGDSSQASTIYAAVTNIDTATQTIAVTISFVALES